MSAGLKLFLSMSASGALLILALLAGKRLLKNILSRQWQYYIWLIVILRLLLPFGPETNLMGRTYREIDRTIASAGHPAAAEPPAAAPLPEAGSAPETEAGRGAAIPLTDYIWVMWMSIALGMLIRKITVYQSFTRFVKAGAVPVSDTAVLDRLALAAEELDVRKPVELYVNPLVSSPLLTGFFHPCVVLPSADIPEKDFRYIALHELTHCKRRDIFYKWLVQLTVCLHWFNPLVHLMSREIGKDCEFSCDEAVLAKAGNGSAQDYGQTLLDAMAAAGKYKENLGAVTLSENKRLLKERIGAIMNYKKRSTAVRLLTAVLTLCMMFGASFIGLYSTAGAANQPPDNPRSSDKETAFPAGKYSQMAEKYYKAKSLPLFQMAFSRLDADAQNAWLERLYEDGDFAFFSAAADCLDEGSSLLGGIAEKAYADDEIAFFSALANRMSETELELWLDRALEDGNWAFQSMLFDRLDRGEEFDKLESEKNKEWAEAQAAEYRAVGVAMDGKDYYYQGKLVNVFLDIRPNKSVYTLNMNPKGSVNVKIIRDSDNKITGAAHMTDEEIEDLFGDEDEMEIIPVDLKTAASGAAVALGEYTLSEGDEIYYSVAAEKGAGMQVYFTKGQQKNPVYWSVHNLRQEDEDLTCCADFIVESPAKPGVYKLFLSAPDGALEDVQGTITIVHAGED